MSKFSVGDRVVVVRDPAFEEFVGSRGVVSRILGEDMTYPIEVDLPDGEGVPFKPEELEFEHVYDELSKKPCADEAPPSGTKVDTRLDDVVEHPQHYTSHPSGVECKDIIGHYPFFIGSAMKYLWRAGLKTEDPIEDLRKAAKNIEFEIERRMAGNSGD